MSASRITLVGGAAPPTPGSGSVSLYPGTDLKPKIKDPNGDIFALLSLEVDAGGSAFSKWTQLPLGPGNSSNVNINAADKAFTMGFNVPFGLKIDTIGISIAAAAPANPSGSIGIYSFDGATKHVAVDSLDWTGTGYKEYTITETLLDPGWYIALIGCKDSSTLLFSGTTGVAGGLFAPHTIRGLSVSDGALTPATITPPGKGRNWAPYLYLYHTDIVF